MRRMTTQLRNLMMLVAVVGLSAFSTKAATFTAAASGNFSANSTWQGGVAPGTMISGDNIVIPSGITVMLDQNLQMTSSAVLSVGGTLTSSGKYYISLVSSSMTNSGTVTVDSLAANFTSGFLYTGTLNVRSMSVANATFTTATNLNISEAVYLNGGTLSIGTLTNLTLDNNSTIVVQGGSMSIASSTIGLNNSYNVIYRGSSAMAGVELQGSGLLNVEVDPGAGNTVTMTDDVEVAGLLRLTSGELVLSGNELIISGSGDFATGGNGTINATAGDDITISTANSITGALRFSSGKNTLDDFTVNITNSGGSVKLDDNLNVAGTLSLQSGMIDVQNNTLILMTGSAVAGGSALSYVMTSGGGNLAADVTGSATTMFHIGTGANYAPVSLTGNSGSATTRVTTRVMADVMANGSTGADVSTTQPLVDATWFIETTASGVISVNMDAFWNSSMEVNSFDRTKAYISHYTNGSWDADAAASASTTTSGMYKITRNNITSFSPFAVFDQNTSVSVENVANEEVAISLYPNPATDVLNIRYDGNQTVNAEVYSVNGQLVQTATLEAGNGNINISALNNGMYYIRLSGEGVTGTQKFIKQ